SRPLMATYSTRPVAGAQQSTREVNRRGTMAATNKTSRAVLMAALYVIQGAGAAHAGDDQYLDRMDKITFGAGNAVAHNIAVQTINPWPAYVHDDRINIDGRRIALGYRRYQANRSIPPRGLSTSGLTFSSS